MNLRKDHYKISGVWGGVVWVSVGFVLVEQSIDKLPYSSVKPTRAL